MFFLDFPTDVCCEGVEGCSGMKREDMPWVEHEFDEEFRQYIIDFPAERRPQMVDALEDAAARAVCVSIPHPRQSWCKRSLMF